MTRIASAPVGDNDQAYFVTPPACGCGNGPVSRFVTIDGDQQLTCTDCFRKLTHAGEVTHHVRTSHEDCPHDRTAADRAKCRSARARGEVFVGDGYGDDDTDGAQVLTTASGTVHQATEDGEALCRPGKATKGDIEDVDGDGFPAITCKACTKLIVADAA